MEGVEEEGLKGKMKTKQPRFRSNRLNPGETKRGFGLNPL